MEEKWKILLYTTLKGDKPVNVFIQNLEYKTQTKVYKLFELLKIYGLSVGSPHIKKLSGTELWELRIVGSDNIRFIYITKTGKVIVVLHGFKKKKNKTPKKEIRIAKDRLNELRLRR